MTEVTIITVASGTLLQDPGKDIITLPEESRGRSTSVLINADAVQVDFTTARGKHVRMIEPRSAVRRAPSPLPVVNMPRNVGRTIGKTLALTAIHATLTASARTVISEPDKPNNPYYRRLEKKGKTK